MQMMAEAGKIGTIIVKDLSRFGREQVEAGRLTQIVYPSLGITFISIQENVNSTTGEGMEMLPYTGCAVNFKSTTVSYKVHKVIYNDFIMILKTIRLFQICKSRL